ncbi:hypothetical protein HERIO_2542 [Hepatospora eriocheir]|uniref:Uncharacterized protein n=1 Tax=Hepatospora eriocheir TaxID=1081669 RepID=A0A1X0Q6J0_9MICR|nr:hypothetical protein HERIO_2542 [Hepatospora eriocheir]
MMFDLVQNLTRLIYHISSYHEVENFNLFKKFKLLKIKIRNNYEIVNQNMSVSKNKKANVLKEEAFKYENDHIFNSEVESELLLKAIDTAYEDFLKDVENGKLDTLYSKKEPKSNKKTNSKKKKDSLKN